MSTLSLERGATAAADSSPTGPAPSTGSSNELPQVLLDAQRAAQSAGLPYAGSVAPAEAWRLVQDGAATLVDVRSPEELRFVGRVPGVVHVAWASGTALTRNPRFVKELESRTGGRSSTLLLLCRSGKRSAEAAAAATKAGFAQVFNVREGFEGELDVHQQRGTLGGWRHHGLPWQQD